jgi:2-keto-4-pentenoate hydratase/2-oxohepta-3-ene-1,7-dioic acid hydratase in catechol pathway
LILSQEDGTSLANWRLGRDVLPPGCCTGTAGDALRLLQNWSQWTSDLRWLGPQIDLATIPDLQWLPPVVEPNKIICIGLNYADHATETGAELPTIPVVFNKFPTTLVGHEQPIRLPGISEKVDYEAELVVVIGKPGRHIDIADAMEHVGAYTCGHDVSARDWQKGKPGGQWLLGKTFDTFAPLGPWLVTAKGPDDAADLGVQFRLNGQLMQDSSTRHFIFSIAFLISHLSKFCTLLPGDLLFTGTPSGVGVARTPPVFLQPGDRAEVRIEGLGTLANPVIAD